MEITREQFLNMVNKSPQGIQPEEIAQSLFRQGYTLQGFDVPQITQPVAPMGGRPQIDPNFRTTPTQQDTRNFFQKARDFTVGMIGGGKVAEGLGKTIAMEETLPQMQQAQFQQSNIALNLTQAIRQKQEAGEDTSRLVNALNTLTNADQQTQQAVQDLISDLPSNKEVIGSAARLATTMGSGVIARGVTGGQLATGVAKGVQQGAKVGATLGGLQGLGLGAEQDKDAAGIVGSGVVGALTGAALGGAVGGVTGKISGAKEQTQRKLEQLVSPKMSAKERAQAIAQGRLEDAGFLKKAEIVAGRREKQIANAVKDVVKPNQAPGKNISALDKEIGRIARGVDDYVTQNKVPFNKAQLKTQLKRGTDELDLIFASDSSAKRTYDALSEAFIKQLKKGDTKGLLETRQAFDKLPAVKKLLQTETLGENTRREMVLAIRRNANKFIAEQLPKGNTFRADMLKEHLMYEALGNIADKASGEIGKNILSQVVKNHPMLKWLVGASGASATYKIFSD
jgi:hypothetical protein